MNTTKISEEVYNDLREIYIGLLKWDKVLIEYDHAKKYVDKIKNEIYKIPTKAFHFKAKYKEHLKHGSKVHTYKVNSRTQWYIIYDIKGDVYYIKK